MESVLINFLGIQHCVDFGQNLKKIECEIHGKNAEDSVFVTHLIQMALSRHGEIKRAMPAHEVPDRCF